MNKIVGILVIIISIIIFSIQCVSTNDKSSARLNKMKNSSNYEGGRFKNSIPTRMLAEGKFWDVVLALIKGGEEHRRPPQQLPIVKLTKNDFHDPPQDELHMVWLGHSSVLIEFEGKRYLMDPVFGKRASFAQWVGPKRYHPVPLGVEDLPRLDGVIISHNHYDHMDARAIQKLSDRNLIFYVPLGIGAALESWGINTDRIVEFDWWDEVADGNIKLVAVPARHYSGRGIFDRNKAFWCSWVIMGNAHRIYFSGDTGMLPDFHKIGAMYGPFDVTFIKIGAYNVAWPDTHINPEQAIQAHLQLNGRRFIPIHWGTFDLGLHSWYEPVERLVKAAGKESVEYSIPKPGEILSLTDLEEDPYWWRQYK